MDVTTVKKWVEEIREIADDDEAAHGEEDRLRGAVLEAIAKMGGDAGDLAEAALETGKIDFQRWYA